MNELTRVENGVPSVGDPGHTEALMASKDPMWIMQLAIERGITDVGALERYTDLCLKMQAIKAKGDYDRAMKALQDECPKVRKTKPVIVKGQIAYYYAPLDLIIEVVRVCISKHGFSWKFGEGESKDNQMAAICTVKHIGGHSEDSRATLRKGAGNHLMDDTKIDASTLSFAQRRAFCGAFGIVPEGDDMEANIQNQKPKNPSSMAPDDSTLRTIAISLWEVLKPVRGAAKNWGKSNEWLHGVAILKEEEELPNIPKERYEQVIEAAKRQLKAEEKP